MRRFIATVIMAAALLVVAPAGAAPAQPKPAAVAPAPTWDHDQPVHHGTEVKDNPGGFYVGYVDFHLSPTFGDWHDTAVGTSALGTCWTQGKWGNLPVNGFVQLRQVSGVNCRWGGIRIGWFGNGHVQYIPLNFEGSDRYCVGSTSPHNVGGCTQLSDGSILLGAPGPIVTADLITCIGGPSAVIDVSNPWRCRHDFWAISF